MMKSLFFLLFSLIFCSKNYDYQINFLGIPVANCLVNLSDTIVSNQRYKNLNYKVQTNSFINNFFKIDNHYTVIIDTTNFNTIFYKKTTYQPEVTNNIQTTLVGDSLIYNNSDIKVSIEDKNIFTILYMFEANDFNKLRKINTIEREGKYYQCEFDEKKINTYKLTFNELNPNNYGVIKHTDIFLWGLFLENSYNQIVMDKSNSYIKKCYFKKGPMRISANLIK